MAKETHHENDKTRKSATKTDKMTENGTGFGNGSERSDADASTNGKSKGNDNSSERGNSRPPFRDSSSIQTKGLWDETTESSNESGGDGVKERPLSRSFVTRLFLPQKQVRLHRSGISGSFSRHEKNTGENGNPRQIVRSCCCSCPSFSSFDDEAQFSGSNWICGAVGQPQPQTNPPTLPLPYDPCDDPLAVSPFVWAPMMRPSAVTGRCKEVLILDYLSACSLYGCSTGGNVGVMTTLRYSLPALKARGPFGDADMLALCEILLQHCNTSLAFIQRLDFSGSKMDYFYYSNDTNSSSNIGMGGNSARGGYGYMGSTSSRHGFTSHGALALAKVLQQTKNIKEVWLPRHRIGPYGASALFLACATNPSIVSLNLRRCRIGARGAMAFCEILLDQSTTQTQRIGLRHVDLSANRMGFHAHWYLERALENYNQQHKTNKENSLSEQEESPVLMVNTDGNLVFQEIMNSCTHGLGVVLLGFVGWWCLWCRVRDKSYTHQVSCNLYSLSLLVLYTSSTLYHSFFVMRHTRYIFAVLDKCAIYILIAGSYTPFLQIGLQRHVRIWWSPYLLALLWTFCVLGISVEAFCPTWRHKGSFSLAMYLGMGWLALVCLPYVKDIFVDNDSIAQTCPAAEQQNCQEAENQTNSAAAVLHLLVLGGVSYTGGVPFFLRNHNLDHSIWHLFVLAGSIFHWCAVYFYVAVLP